MNNSKRLKNVWYLLSLVSMILLIVVMMPSRVYASVSTLSLEADASYTSTQLSGYDYIMLNGYSMTVSDDFTTSSYITLGTNGTLVVNGNMTASNYVDCSNGNLIVNGNMTASGNVFCEKGLLTVDGNYTQNANRIRLDASIVGIFGDITFEGNGYVQAPYQNSNVSIGGDFNYSSTADCTENKATWTVYGSVDQMQSSGKLDFYYLSLPAIGTNVSFTNGRADIIEIAGTKSQYTFNSADCYDKLIAVSTVTFNALEGRVRIGSKQVKTESMYGELPTATRAGYEFAGWYTALDGGELVTSETIVKEVENSTLYAHWIVKEGPEFSIFDVPDGCAMQARLYNPNSGEHFYTGSIEEVQNLIDAGWNFEGPGFITPTVGIPIYRLYSEEHGDHFYTTDETERDNLIAEGWKYEDVAFPSAASGKAIYRLYNPNAYNNNESGAHHFTADWDEATKLANDGWIYEGIAWYSL